MKKLLKRAFGFVASFGFAVVLILLLFILTFLGTLEQVEHGLFEVQKKYFDSLYLVHDFNIFNKFTLSVPLPGAYLVMGLFLCNLIAGGIIRIRKNWKTPGNIIGHIGIIVMLVGGYVTLNFSDNGNMRLFEGESSNEFYSYYDWMIEVGNPSETDELLVISQEEFMHVGTDESRLFYSDDLPFDIELAGFKRNSTVAPVRPAIAGRVHAVDGFYLEGMDLGMEAEQNVAGGYVTVTDKETGETTEGILWGLAQGPLTVDYGGSQWTVKLARKRWQVPFTITLDTFIHDLHPGTQMASHFESEVTKTENGVDEEIRIWMNHPLRYQGYTFFQSSWGQMPNGDVYSVFSVVKNPADDLPLYSCIIVGVGMLIHFTQKLTRYLKLENKRRAA